MAVKAATLYCMVLPDLICPFGIEATRMLEDAAYAVDEQILSSRAKIDGFEAEHGVDTTPQGFINKTRVGGSDDLIRNLEQS